MEIYNEHIKDLLQPSNINLDVREAPGKGTFVAGAANVEVASRDDVESLLEAGNAYRTTESTQLNMVSSRSHAVLQLRCSLGERHGKLSLIDLAGSEVGGARRLSNCGSGRPRVVHLIRSSARVAALLPCRRSPRCRRSQAPCQSRCLAEASARS